MFVQTHICLHTQIHIHIVHPYTYCASIHGHKYIYTGMHTLAKWNKAAPDLEMCQINKLYIMFHLKRRNCTEQETQTLNPNT